MAENCRLCNETKFFLRMKGGQVGRYCAGCGSWAKWVGKKEVQGMKLRGIPVLPETAEPELLGGGDLGLAYSGGHTASSGYGGGSVPPYLETSSYGGAGGPALEGNGYGSAVPPMEECAVCSGDDLDPISGTAVRLAVFDGVLMVTSPDGQNLYGSYKVSYCPSCSRKL